jgi:hypothetical protein
MSDSASPTETTVQPTTGRKAISARFLVIIAVLGVTAYFGVPQVMKYVMFLEEKGKASQPPTFNKTPEGRPPSPVAAE